MSQILSKQNLKHLHNMLDKELQNMEQNLFIHSKSELKFKKQEKSIKQLSIKKISTNNSELDYLQKRLKELEQKMQNAASNQIKILNQGVQINEFKKIYQFKQQQNKAKTISSSIQLKKQNKQNASNSNRSKTNTLQKQVVQQDSPLKRKYQQQMQNLQKNTQKQDIKKFKNIKKLNKQNQKSLKQSKVSKKQNERQNLINSRSRSKPKSSRKLLFFKENKNGKMQLLQKQLMKYKVQNKKLSSKIRALELISEDYKKLQQNFEKSEYIRKQQKILIQNCKNKHSKYN